MSKRKKVLIAYATAGIGHKKAATAIKEALLARGADLDVKLVDVLDYTKPFFKKAYPNTYLFLISHLVHIWGFLYHFLNFRVIYPLFYPIRKLSHVLNGPGLIKFLREYRPDIVVSTHFLLPDICDYVKREYSKNGTKIGMRVVNVITDYRVHSFWISPSVDIYIAGHEDTMRDLVRKWRIPPERVKIMGIPVEPKFYIRHEKDSIREKLGIPRRSFTVLVTSGGYGVGPIFEILETLNKASFPLTAITVCGHNEKLFAEVEDFSKKAKIHVVNLGYADNIDELLASSDICIGKAGGISTTEAFCQGVPFIFIRPIPGQERRNADLFARAGCGFRLGSVAGILNVVEKLHSSPEKMKTLKENIRRAKKPDPAFAIAEFIEALAKKA